MRATPVQAVARFRCLYLMFLRGHAERSREQRASGRPLHATISPTEQLAICNAALVRPDIQSALTPSELRILKTKPGKLRKFEVAASIISADAAATLAEFLGGWKPSSLVGRESHAVCSPGFSPDAMLGASAPSWLTDPSLPSLAEARHRFRVLEAYTWRYRVEELKLTIAFRDRHGESDRSKEEFLASVVARRSRLWGLAGLFEPLDDDFPVGKRTFSRYFDEQVTFAMLHAASWTQRLRAARWLMRPSNPWDDTRAPTAQRFEIPKELAGSGGADFLACRFDPDVDADSYRGI